MLYFSLRPDAARRAPLASASGSLEWSSACEVVSERCSPSSNRETT
jgi:hypothetical protein